MEPNDITVRRAAYLTALPINKEVPQQPALCIDETWVHAHRTPKKKTKKNNQQPGNLNFQVKLSLCLTN
jgi:hypothetical protein